MAALSLLYGMFDNKDQEMVNRVRRAQCPACGRLGTCHVTTIVDTNPAIYDYQCSACKHSGTMGQGVTKNPVDTWQDGLKHGKSPSIPVNHSTPQNPVDTWQKRLKR